MKLSDLDPVTVGETYFFRQREHFDILERDLLPKWIMAGDNASRTLRIWSAGCSSGEEPYSIAILLLEALPFGQEKNISILATDTHRERLRLAQEGIYGPRAVRHVPTAWLEKYFREDHGKYILSEKVKEKVHFAYHNLEGDDYGMEEMQGLDFLFCRNVTIYFHLDSTKKVFERFSRCLRPGGYLFTGIAEVLWQISDKFVPEEFPEAIVYRCLPEGTGKTWQIPPSVEILAPIFEEPPKVEAPSEKKELTARLAEASLLGDRGKVEEAVKILRQILKEDNLLTEAYYLLGLFYSKNADNKEALGAFKQALYTDPSLALAYVHSAQIHLRQGDTSGAGREFQNALKVLDGRPEEECVRFSDDLTCGYLRTICRHYLELFNEMASKKARGG